MARLSQGTLDIGLVATPQWLAAKPLIFNDSTTHMYRLTMEWFAAAGYGPRARIELNPRNPCYTLPPNGCISYCGVQDWRGTVRRKALRFSALQCREHFSRDGPLV
jgi:hypothetical protein